MAYQLKFEFAESIRQSPVRTALALLILITTSVYALVAHDGYRVAEIGETNPSESPIDLAAHQTWADGSEPLTSDEEEIPATATQVGDRQQYIDARLTHAVVEEDDTTAAKRLRATPVSAESVRHSSTDSPVWLLGVLLDD